jgi:hypothetical protein
VLERHVNPHRPLRPSDAYFMFVRPKPTEFSSACQPQVNIGASDAGFDIFQVNAGIDFLGGVRWNGHRFLG